MKLKKLLALILAAACLVSCAPGKEEKETSKSKGKKKTETVDKDKKKKKKASQKVSEDEADELTLHMHFFGYCVYDETWPIWQEAEKRTGIKVKGTASEVISDSAQAYNTMLVSDKLSDIIHYTTKDLANLAEDGGLIPLDDLIDEYAPNIKTYFEKYPEAKRACTVTVDGEDHIYFINGSNSGIENGGKPAVRKGWFIRTDWLKKLGLEEPETLEEFYQVMKAFREQDPNGNGKRDEVPLFERQEGITAYLQLWDAYSGWHLRNGKAVYGETEEEYKNAIRDLSKWYKEGLIDKEIFTRGQQAREQLLGQNLGGCTSDWFSSTSKYNDMYKDSIPGFEFMPIDPPKDIRGVQKEVATRSQFHSMGWGISKDCKYPVTAIKYMDFWMSQEGRDLISFGIEGEHYTIKNGKKQFTDRVLSADGGASNYMRNQGQVEIGTIINIESELMGMNEIGRAGFERYIDRGYAVKTDECILTTEESTEIEKIMNNISTYTNEMQQKWILGEADVDATWDEYIKTINDYGYDKVQKIEQKGYDRGMGKK